MLSRHSRNITGRLGGLDITRMLTMNSRGIRVVLENDRDAPIEIGVAKQEVKMLPQSCSHKAAT